MTLQQIEKKARDMAGKEFFATYETSREFRKLSLETRRSIRAAKYGLTWEQYITIPAADRVNLNLAKSGLTYMSGINTGVKAAQADARFSYFRGMAGGVRALGFIGIAAVLGAAYVFRKPILKTIQARSK